MLKKSVLTPLFLALFLGLFYQTKAPQTNEAGQSSAQPTEETAFNTPQKAISTLPTSAVQESGQQSTPHINNPRWLEPIITRTLNTQTTWNNQGTEKKVVSIVEADFHNPYLRIEETYSVDPYTEDEQLISYIPSTADTLLAQVKGSVDESDQQQMENSLGIHKLSQLRGTNIWRYKIANFTQTDRLPQLLASMTIKLGPLLIAEPDYIIHSLRTLPDDPLFSKQPGFDSNSSSANDSDIDAPEAWDIQTDASEIVVAILDSGIRADHEDLDDNLWRNSLETNNGVDDDENGIVDDLIGANFITNTGGPEDDNGHGTLVAGILGAEGDNAIGVAGVAWNVQLMAVKILNEDGIGTYSDGIEAIQYAIDQRVDIINNSWGGSGYSKLLENIFKKASDQGIILATAAGNDGNLLSDVPVYPAAYEIANQVVVGSTDENDHLADFSNYDPSLVHIMAPEGAFSTWHEGTDAYRYNAGTSFSTPFVAGTFALMKAQTPEINAQGLIDRLLNSGEYRLQLRDLCLTRGRLNSYRAIVGETNIPENDHFENALVLQAEGETVSDSLNYATLQENEAIIYDNMSPHSVWYRWTSPRNGTAFLKLKAPRFLGALGIYKGDSLDQLERLGRNRPESEGVPINLEIQSVEGESYYIQIGRVSGLGGYFSLSLALSPPNDDIADSEELDGTSFETTGALALATQEPDEPTIHPSGSGKTVWYKWTAPQDGTLFLTINSNQGQLFANAFQDIAGDLNSIDVSFDQGRPDRLLFNVASGSRYFFGIDAQSNSTDLFSLEGSYLGTPRFTIEPPDTSSRAGTDVVLNVGVLGLGDPVYQWYFNDVPIEGANQSFLLLTNFQTANVGDYYVIVQITGIELQSRTASLSLTDADILILQEPEPRIATQGSTATLSVLAEPKSLLSYQWYKNGQPLEEQTNSTLSIENADTHDTGFYHVDIILGGESATSTHALLRIIEGETPYAGTPWVETDFGTPDMEKLVVAGDYMFALSGDGKIGFSEDGVHWHYSSIYGGADNNWIAYGNEKYVVAADNGVYWSTDLFNWTQSSVGHRTNQIAFGNGAFIIATNKGILRSTDGEAWTQIQDPSAPENESAVWAGDKFIVINRDEEVFSSPDGQSWEVIGTADYHRAENLVFLDDKLWTTAPSIGYSTDGLTWTILYWPEGGAALATDVDSGGDFLTNGIDLWELQENEWVIIEPSPSNASLIGHQIINGQPVGLKAGRPIPYHGPINDTGFPTSLNDPYFANEKFIAHNYSSINGINWLNEDNGTHPSFYDDDVAYGNGVYVFGKSWGGILGSLQSHDYEFIEVEFGNGVFVAADRENVYRSVDGSSWDVVITVESTSRHKLLFANGKFLHHEERGIRTSVDGQTWTVHGEATPQDFDYLIYEDGLYLGVHRFGVSKTSTDGISWSAEADITIPNHSDQVTGVTFFDDQFFVLNGGILFHSNDATTWTAVNNELYGYDAEGLVSGNGRMLTLTEAGPVVWTTGPTGTGSTSILVNGETPGSTVLVGQELTFSIEAFSSSPIQKIALYEGGQLVSEIFPPQNVIHYQVSRHGAHALQIEVTLDNGNKSTKEIAIQGTYALLSKELGGIPVFNDIIYFKGAFYGAGPGGLVYQSLNGQDWNRIETPTNKDLNGFHVAPAGLCAVAEPDVLLFSPNGVDWKRIPLDNLIWRNPQKIENSFFAIACRDEIGWLSYNGVEWYSLKSGLMAVGAQDSASPAQANEFIDLDQLWLGRPGVPGVELFLNGNEINNSSSLMVGETLITVKENEGVYSTEDGISWENISPLGWENRTGKVQYLGNTLFLLEENGRNSYAVTHISPRELNWEEAPSPSFIGNMVFKEGNYYIGSERSFRRSTDGVAWEKIAGGAFIEEHSDELGELVSSPVGFLSFSKGSGQDPNFQYSFSADGLVWSPTTAISHYNSDILGGGAHLYALAEDQNYLRNSQMDWLPSSTEIPEYAQWRNGVFLALQENPGSTYLRSEDAQNWTDTAYPDWMAGRTFSPLVQNANSAFWLSYNHFFFEPEKNFLAKSVDGLSWERIPHPKPTGDPTTIFEFGDWIYVDNYRSQDNGTTWEDFLGGVSGYWIAATSNYLLLLIDGPNGSLNAQRFDGQIWEEITLPDSRDPLWFLASEDTVFFVSYDWIYASKDGASWEIVAPNGNSENWFSVSNNTLFQSRRGTSIGQLTEYDVGIHSLTVNGGEYGVSDRVSLSFELTNSGRKLISLAEDNPLEIELLLSQRGGSWGNGSNGHSVLVSYPIPSLSLNPGSSTTINLDLEVPETVIPGAYYLSARIKDHPLLADPNSANDYIIGDQATVSIPAKSLEIVEIGNGEVTSDSALAKIPFKKPVRLFPQAYFGHEFYTWSGDLDASSEIATIIMDSDKQVEAMFIPKIYNVAVQAYGSGSVLGTPQNGYATHGDSVQLEAVAEGDATFLGWSGDRVSTEPVLQIEVGRDLQLVALFSQTIDSWLENRYSAEQLNDPEIGGLLADHDGNRLTNLQEFLFGFETPESESPAIEFYQKGNELCIRYPRSLTTMGDERLEVWYSQDLQTWEDSEITTQVVSKEGRLEYIEACIEYDSTKSMFIEIRAISE